MNKEHKRLIAQNGATKLIDTLEPLYRLGLDNRLTNIQVTIESPSDINNALAVIRSCEALGVSRKRRRL